MVDTAKAIALFELRKEIECGVGPRVALTLRDYFRTPDLAMDASWPQEWKELARINAGLGEIARAGGYRRPEVAC